MDNKNNGNGDELRNILGKLLGETNVPDDCVIQAVINDQRLQKLAEYDLTKGFTDLKVDAEAFQTRFAEFKNTVRAKSSTLAELETTVYSRWGVLEKPRIDASHNQTSLSEMNMEFAERKPVTGFAPALVTDKKKGNKERKG